MCSSDLPVSQRARHNANPVAKCTCGGGKTSKAARHVGPGSEGFLRFRGRSARAASATFTRTPQPHFVTGHPRCIGQLDWRKVPPENILLCFIDPASWKAPASLKNAKRPPFRLRYGDSGILKTSKPARSHR